MSMRCDKTKAKARCCSESSYCLKHARSGCNSDGGDGGQPGAGSSPGTPTAITGTPRAVGQARSLKRATSTTATALQPAH